MNNNFYSIFKKIIRECNYTNTYKMAWAKAIVEISLENKQEDKIICIEIEQIAEKFIKYYWNHTIFFDLIQGSNILKTPIVIQEIKKLIEKYYSKFQNRKPERYEKVENLLKEQLSDEYIICLKNIIRTIKADVSWRFTIINGNNYQDLYKYLKGDDKLEISKENVKSLKENYEELFDLINYKWGLILENFNNSPRINKKVRIIDEQNIRRKPLIDFKEYLDIENEERICFICGNKICDEELSIDHVIPWSYLYSDDLWNLVYAHKSCNSSKSNIIPSENDIKKLKERNEKLMQLLKEKNKKGKHVEELSIAIEKDFVDKFWIGCKG